VAEAPLPPLRIHSHYWPDPGTQPPAYWDAELRTYGISDIYVVDKQDRAGRDHRLAHASRSQPDPGRLGNGDELPGPRVASAPGTTIRPGPASSTPAATTSTCSRTTAPPPRRRSRCNSSRTGRPERSTSRSLPTVRRDRQTSVSRSRGPDTPKTAAVSSCRAIRTMRMVVLHPPLIPGSTTADRAAATYLRHATPRRCDCETAVGQTRGPLLVSRKGVATSSRRLGCQRSVLAERESAPDGAGA
jgi:hypothetical protein